MYPYIIIWLKSRPVAAAFGSIARYGPCARSLLLCCACAGIKVATSLALSAGAHIYAENGSECGVQASGNALFIQAIGPNDAGTRSGVRHVLLPQPLLVTNAESGAKVCATACTRFEVDLDAGHSGLFIVEAAAVAESA